MVEVRMGESRTVDPFGIKAEGLRVLFHKLPLPLVKAAVDENPLARALDQVAGTRDIMVGAVEGKSQLESPVLLHNEYPLLDAGEAIRFAGRNKRSI